jgi:hypothetical protein
MQTPVYATIRRVVQVTVATKLTAAVTLLIPSFGFRTAVSVGAAVLCLGVPRLPSSAKELALAVVAATLLQGVMVQGPASLALSLAHCCMVLELGQALPLDHLGDTFLGNTQFLFAQTVGQLLVGALAPVMAFIAACGLAGCALWWASRDTLLSTALTQAAIFVLRTILMRGIPPGLRLPTVGALLCFSRPLCDLPVHDFAEPLYTFALYQAGETLRDTLQAVCSPLVATLAAVALVCVSPAPVFTAAAQMAAVSAATDLATRAVAPVADTDPVLCLLPLLVFTAVLEAGLSKKDDANPPGGAP